MGTCKLLRETDLEMAYGIAGASFDPEYPWTLYMNAPRAPVHEGYTRIVITDRVFHEAIERGAIRIGQGDVMVCEVGLKQWQTGSGLITEQQIKAVVEYHPGLGRTEKVWVRPIGVVPDPRGGEAPDGRAQ